MSSKWVLPLALLVLAGALGTRWWVHQSSGEQRVFQEVQIGDSTVELVVSSTAAQLQQGLSDRVGIGADGMLFVFEKPMQTMFWMYHMQFPLDFVWIARQGDTMTVVDLHQNVPTHDEAQADGITRVAPNAPVVAIIEFPAGWIEQHSIEVGDTVVFTDRQRTAMW